MKSTIISLIAFLFSSLLIANAYSRSPAVEPVRGISIEEYDQVPPSKAKGFDFSQAQNTNTAEVHKGTRTISSVTEQPAKPTSSNLSASLMVAFLFSIPFIMWFGVMRVLEQKSPGSIPEHNELLSFKNRNKSYELPSESEDDIDYPKAS
jgi:Sec-independent protein secretion pathway component TatC